MRMFVVILFISAFISCNKNLEINLPAYKSEIVVEMYLEDNAVLKCLISESLSYLNDTITQQISHANVIFSDGVETDTLLPADLYDYETGRHYNYSCGRIFFGNNARTYTLQVTDSTGRKITASTKMPPVAVKIDSLIYSSSPETKNMFSVGLSFKDPANTTNYYRVIVGEGINNYDASNTDVVFPDITFDGQQYGLNSEAGYQEGQTVTVRLYTLSNEHYDYLQSVKNAQASTVNPFVQPVQTTSNIIGGQGIFTAIRYDERKLVIR